MPPDGLDSMAAHERESVDNDAKVDAERERECVRERERQARHVMPLIGPLLDAWDGMGRDEQPPALLMHIEEINNAMEGEPL